MPDLLPNNREYLIFPIGAMGYTIGQIAALLGLEMQGDPTRVLQRVALAETADEHSLVFVQSAGAESLKFSGSRPACILAPKECVPEGINAIFSTQPKLDFARAALYLHPRPKSRGTRHATAIVSQNACVDATADLGPHVVVEAGVRVGKGCILQAGTILGEGCSLGEECILFPGVVIYPGAQIGNRVTLHAGVKVGSDGFGYVFDGQVHWKFPQVGRVIIEDDVEIGANSTIDRGSLGTTRIGAGTKVDNLVQIAHNVDIGRHVVIAAQTGISGSTVVEDYAVIGGQVGMGDHARVQTGAVIGSKAGVLPGKIVRGNEVYWGIPVRPLREYKRLNALFGRLPEMKSEIELLKKEIAFLRAELEKR